MPAGADAVSDPRKPRRVGLDLADRMFVDLQEELAVALEYQVTTRPSSKTRSHNSRPCQPNDAATREALRAVWMGQSLVASASRSQ